MDIIGVLTGLLQGHNEDIEGNLEENTGTQLANDDNSFYDYTFYRYQQ